MAPEAQNHEFPDAVLRAFSSAFCAIHARARARGAPTIVLCDTRFEGINRHGSPSAPSMRRVHAVARTGRRAAPPVSECRPQKVHEEAVMKQWIDPAYCDIRLGFEVTAYVYVR